MGNGLTVRRSTTAGPSNLFRSGPVETESFAGMTVVAPCQSPDGVEQLSRDPVTFHHDTLIDLDTEDFP